MSWVHCGFDKNLKNNSSPTDFKDRTMFGGPFTYNLIIDNCHIIASIINMIIRDVSANNFSWYNTQNGFRAGRSCINHIFSLVTVLRNRELHAKETFLCFVDFRRAFDSVNHVLLFNVLSTQFGIVGKMYKSLVSLYKDPLTRVILTSENSSLQTDYFDRSLGVKQGDILSPTLFSMFVNSLTLELLI